MLRARLRAQASASNTLRHCPSPPCTVPCPPRPAFRLRRGWAGGERARASAGRTLLLLVGGHLLPLGAEGLADLAWRGGLARARRGRHAPNAMPGLAAITVERWSLTKNMYEERFFLGPVFSALVFFSLGSPLAICCAGWLARVRRGRGRASARRARGARKCAAMRGQR
jgi:hypothetical protein